MWRELAVVPVYRLMELLARCLPRFLTQTMMPTGGTASPEQQVLPARLVLLVLRVHKVQSGRPGRQALLDLPDRPDLQAQLGRPDLPTTMLSLSARLCLGRGRRCPRATLWRTAPRTRKRFIQKRTLWRRPRSRRATLCGPLPALTSQSPI